MGTAVANWHALPIFLTASVFASISGAAPRGVDCSAVAAGKLPLTLPMSTSEFEKLVARFSTTVAPISKDRPTESSAFNSEAVVLALKAHEREITAADIVAMLSGAIDPSLEKLVEWEIIRSPKEQQRLIFGSDPDSALGRQTDFALILAELIQPYRNPQLVVYGVRNKTHQGQVHVGNNLELDGVSANSESGVFSIIARYFNGSAEIDGLQIVPTETILSSAASATKKVHSVRIQQIGGPTINLKSIVVGRFRQDGSRTIVDRRHSNHYWESFPLYEIVDGVLTMVRRPQSLLLFPSGEGSLREKRTIDNLLHNLQTALMLFDPSLLMVEDLNLPLEVAQLYYRIRLKLAEISLTPGSRGVFENLVTLGLAHQIDVDATISAFQRAGLPLRTNSLLDYGRILSTENGERIGSIDFLTGNGDDLSGPN